MELEKFYEEVDGNYESVLSRLPSENMIRKFVNKFVADPTFGQLKDAFEDKDIGNAFMASHTLKGTAANLGLDSLAEEASELTEKLRNADTFPEEKYFEQVKRAYETVIEKIAQLD